MKKEIVISLGGSLIVPENVDTKTLLRLKKVIDKHKRNYKFVFVCGGGSIARKYIHGLKEIGKSNYLQSLAGIAVTRLNARFMSYFFGLDPKKGIPHDISHVLKDLKKQGIVFCGALRYEPDQTSDSVAAKLAAHLKCSFINLTNVPGLYNKNPKKFKDAKFIKEISWKDFYKMANAMTYQPGQHFVLDQKASKIILNNKVPTYIIGDNFNQLDNLLSRKKFIGTKIEG
jgi:uridylate kinase